MSEIQNLGSSLQETLYYDKKSGNQLILEILVKIETFDLNIVKISEKNEKS